MINYEGISYNLETIIEFKSLKLLLEALAKKQIEHNILFYGQNNISINKENTGDKPDNNNNNENLEKNWIDKINNFGLIKVFIDSQNALLEKNKEQDKIINELKDKIELLEKNQNQMKEERLTRRITKREKEKDINDIKDNTKEEKDEKEEKKEKEGDINHIKDKAEREIIIINKDKDNKENEKDDKANQNITIINGPPRKEETIINEPINAESKTINIYDTKTKTKTTATPLNLENYNNLEKQLLVLDEKINVLNEKLEEIEQITDNNTNDIDKNKDGISELKKKVKKLEKIEHIAIQNPQSENNQEETKQEELTKNLDEDNELLENKLNELENKIMKDIEQKLKELEKNKSDIDLIKELNSGKEKLKEISDNIYIEINRIKKKTGEIENNLKNLMSLSDTKLINEKIKMLEQELEEYATKNDIRRVLGEVDKFEKELMKSNSILMEQKDINNKNRDEINKLTATFESLKQNFGTLNNLLENNSLAKLIENLNILSDTCVQKEEFEKQIKAINKKLTDLQMDVNEHNRNFGEIMPKIENIVDINELKKMQTKIDDLMTQNMSGTNNKSLNTEEIIKNIKSIEAQVKLFMKKLESEKDKEKYQNENCILASRPVGGFKCASCETYIGEIKESNAFLPWNKIHGAERPYRLGSSFSRILQGLNIEPNFNPFLHQKTLLKSEKDKRYNIQNNPVSVKRVRRIPPLNQLTISEENSWKKNNSKENKITNKTVNENMKVNEYTEVGLTDGNKRKKKLNVNLWGIKSLKNLVNDKSVWTVNIISENKKRNNNSFDKDNNMGQKVMRITKKPKGNKINISSEEKDNNLVIPSL